MSLKMDKITLELTPRQFTILFNHFKQDIGYGVAGTFGDGEDFKYYKGLKVITGKKEYQIAKTILNKMRKEGNKIWV